MKNLLSAFTVLAVAGAAIGAAGYYLYKKNKELNEYEELLYSDELSRDFDRDDTMDQVGDIVSDAAEDVTDTLADAVSDVKDAIDKATE